MGRFMPEPKIAALDQPFWDSEACTALFCDQDRILMEHLPSPKRLNACWPLLNGRRPGGVPPAVWKRCRISS
jgi:hypothetical protein